jgi:putative protease
VTKASKGEVCFIRCPRPVPENASVYKTGESYPRINNKIAALKPMRNKVNLEITITRDNFSVKTQICQWNKKCEFSEAKTHPLNSEKVIDSFKKSNSDSLQAGSITVNINGAIFIPGSILKSIRREFWDFIHPETLNFNFSLEAENTLKKFLIHYKNTIDNKEKILVKNSHIKCGKDALPVEYFKPGIKEVILPAFCPENKLKILKSKILKISEQFPQIKFRVTSLYQFDILKNLQNKHKIIISYPSPVCNVYSVMEYKQLIKKINGILTKAQAWIELEKSELTALSEHSEITIEIFSGGRIPLMSTRAHIPVSGKIHDDRGAEYLIEKDEQSGLTYIYANRALKLPKLKNTASFSNCTSGLTDKITSEFNFNREF